MNQIVKRLAQIALGASALATLASTGATTLVVDAPIIDVERIELGRPASQCEPVRHTLARFLAADLCPDDPVDVIPEYRYRVTYLWDERSYERVLDRPPGTTLPVKVELDW